MRCPLRSYLPHPSLSSRPRHCGNHTIRAPSEARTESCSSPSHVVAPSGKSVSSSGRASYCRGVGELPLWKDCGTRRSTPTRYRALGLGALLQRAWPQRRRGLRERSALGATLVTLPNGSRLSCGRHARGRKEVEAQRKRLAGEATQVFPTCERPPASSAC